MIGVVYYLFNSPGISSQPGRLMLPEWVKVSEKRSSEILNTVTEVKSERLGTNVDGREITESLLKDLGKGILDGHDFKNRYNDIANDIEAIVNKPIITRNQEKIVEIMSLKEIPKLSKSVEQPDTTDMPELENEESVTERKNQ